VGGRRAIAAVACIAFLAACADGDAATRAASPHPSLPASSIAPAVPTAAPTGVAATPSPAIPRTTGWRQIAVTGAAPRAREDHTWTVDMDGRFAYLFGGRDGATVYRDLWRFDLGRERWERVDAGSSGPAARFGHEAAWLPGRGLVIWAGQAGAEAFFNDLWLFDPAAATWRQLPGGGARPVPRYGSCSGVGPDGRLWISHGFTEDGVRFADTRAYEVAAGRWADETPSGDLPVERCLHACWWRSDGTFGLFGGQTTATPALGDLWFLTPGGASANAWREQPEPGPSARQLAAVGRRGPLTILFGGRGLHREPLDDTWALPDDATAFVAMPTPLRPPPRSGATLTFDAAKDRMMLFGGIGDGALADLWSLGFEGGG
jgi:galactose oxidase-like protein